MKILRIALCWNEQKLIKLFLEHHSRICDNIIILDNNSTDRTLEIIKDYPEAYVLPYPIATQNQMRDDIHQTIKNEYWQIYRDAFDWIILGDVDDFLCCAGGDLRRLIKSIECTNPTLPQLYGETWSRGQPLPDYDNLFKSLYAILLSKGHIGIRSLLFNCKKIGIMQYGIGCHDCHPITVEGRSIETQICNGLYLIHMKHTGTIQECEEHLLTGMPRMSKINLENDWGWHTMDKNLVKTTMNNLSLSSTLNLHFLQPHDLPKLKPHLSFEEVQKRHLFYANAKH